MTGKQLRNSILQWAIQGKLVPQDPNDEPASVLLERIREEKARLVKEKKIKKDKNESIIYRGEDNSYYEKFADGSVRCIDDEIPFDIPKGWEWCRIKNICMMQAGKNISSSEIFQDKSDLHPYRCVGGNGLRGYVSTFNTSGHYAIVGRQGALCGCLNIEKGDFYATEHAVIVDSYNILSPIFLYYFLTALNLNQYATATAQPGLAVSNVVEVLFPLPTLLDQNRIIEKLNSVLPLVEEYDEAEVQLGRLNQNLNVKIKYSILQEAVQGRLVPQIESEGTAEELLEEIRAEKKRLVKEGKLKKSTITNESHIFRGEDNKYYENVNGNIVCIDDEIPFAIPTTWQWCRIKTLLNIWSARRVHERDWRTKGIPFYRAREIGKLADNGIVDNDLFIDKALYDDFSSSGIPQIGDLMMTAVGTLGKSYIIENNLPFYFKDGSVLCIGNTYSLNPQYLRMFFNSNIFKNQYISESDGTTVATLTMVRMNKYFIPIPPMKEQARIVDKFNALTSIMSR